MTSYSKVGLKNQKVWKGRFILSIFKIAVSSI